MPLIEVKLFDHRVNDESAAQIVRALTDGLCSVVGDEAREATWVVIEGIPPARWGFGGRSGAEG